MNAIQNKDRIFSILEAKLKYEIRRSGMEGTVKAEECVEVLKKLENLITTDIAPQSWASTMMEVGEILEAEYAYDKTNAW